ncbi:MAG: replication endonuclease [Nitrosomonas sp.]|nr:replication endonuclease [Nitrosomonas sp.]
MRLRTIESISRNIELVTRYRSTYVSDYAVNIKRKQKEKNREYLESTFICNEVGEQFSVQELSDCSVSNPAIRRAELMVRIKGFEMVADHLGHVGEFYTLTTPSRMHACLHTGATNPRYDGTTPLQAHEYLTHFWALIRAELHCRGAYSLTVSVLSNRTMKAHRIDISYFSCRKTLQTGSGSHAVLRPAGQ